MNAGNRLVLSAALNFSRFAYANKPIFNLIIKLLGDFYCSLIIMVNIYYSNGLTGKRPYFYINGLKARSPKMIYN
jgi:hypothetical protein